MNSALNVTAVFMFLIFISATMVITWWASRRTRTASEYYAAGSGITGFQNGLAIAGDYMSAASFLGISALVYSSGFDGLIYSIGFLVGWPVILFLLAERLRNLGKYTFADVVSYRLQQRPIRTVICLRFPCSNFVIPDCANGWCRQVDTGIVWTALQYSCRVSRSADGDLRDGRRYAGNDLGTDYQGLFVTVRSHNTCDSGHVEAEFLT